MRAQKPNYIGSKNTADLTIGGILLKTSIRKDLKL